MNVKFVIVIFGALVVISVDARIFEKIKNSRIVRFLRNKRSNHHNDNSLNKWINVQSPIAISTHEVTVLKHHFEPLKFHGHWESDGQAYIEDTGSSAKITFEGRKHLPYITGGLLKSKEKYKFEQMHLHWGEKDDHGSEHTIDGKTYSMEVHLVHFNAKYHSFDKAVNHKDGLVVVAFFINAVDGDEINHNFAKITDQIPNLRELNRKYSVEPDCLKWMESQKLDKNYFMYHGSLTTSPYNECVTWIIYRTPVNVLKQQVAAFRSLRSADNVHKITQNCRSLQKTDKPTQVIFAGKMDDLTRAE